MNPQTRNQARMTTMSAIRRGEIRRPKHCEECGNTGVEAHHLDYNEPLNVLWLCRTCHKSWHRAHEAVGIEGEVFSPVLQVNITDEDTKQRIRRSLRSFGFPKIGTGVRVVLDTFAKSDEVQRVVRKQLGVHAPTPVEER